MEKLPHSLATMRTSKFCVAKISTLIFLWTLCSFLRWQAVQDAAFIDRDGKEKIWSESHVSEDFDLAMRLQMRGYIIRWATYSKGGFKEGVSLTADDELNRWQKYAYGECLTLLSSVVCIDDVINMQVVMSSCSC
jgi:cellulose synthase/poly-beta-1,6-N-acetylglucosamine synthase-like glycosyltransferase